VSRAKAWLKKLWRPRLYLWIAEQQVQLVSVYGQGTNAEFFCLASVDILASENSSSDLTDLHQSILALAEKFRLHTNRNQDFRVVVSDAWLSIASLPWSALLERQNTAKIFCRDYLNELGFDVGEEDEICLGDAGHGISRLAVIYPSSLLVAIDQFAEKSNLRCVGIRPLSILAWTAISNKVRPEALAILSEQAVILTLATCRRIWAKPILQGYELFRLIGLTAVQGLDAAWRRWKLRHPQSCNIKKVYVIDNRNCPEQAAPFSPPFFSLENIAWSKLQPNAHWLTNYVNANALDAKVRHSRRGWLHWLFLGAAALTSSLLLMQTFVELKKAEVARENFETAYSQQSGPQVVDWSTADLRKIAAVNSAIRQLNMPIGVVMYALQPPKDIRVAVLSIETTTETINTGFNTLKITAEAPTSAEMTRYVAFIADSRPFVRAYLIRHEIPGEDDANFRFIVEAQWEY
jgi:hypothetical protein